MYRAMMATGSLAWAHRRLSTLSGGERQRVHLARTLAVEASVMLLDEPTTHLDPPHQEDIVRLLREQARGGGVSVVSAIHDLSLALAADRIIVLGYRGLRRPRDHRRGPRRRLALSGFRDAGARGRARGRVSLAPVARAAAPIH